MLRLTTPELKKTFGAPFAQHDRHFETFWMYHRLTGSYSNFGAGEGSGIPGLKIETGGTRRITAYPAVNRIVG